MFLLLLHLGACSLARPGYRAAVVEFAPQLAPNQSISQQQAHDHNLANLAIAGQYVAAAAANSGGSGPAGQA